MKPKNLKKISEIKKPKYKFHWYKNMIKLLRNQKCKNYKDNSLISLT